MEENKEGTVNYIYVDNKNENLNKKVKTLTNVVALLTGATCAIIYYMFKGNKDNSSKEDTTKGE